MKSIEYPNIRSRLGQSLCRLSTVFLCSVVGVSALADDSRYIIEVDEANKGLVKALSKRAGGILKLEARGFFAAEFPGRSLSDVRGLVNNPHVLRIDEDFRRYPMGFVDVGGNPATSQVTPYAVIQSQADKLSPADLGTQKVCVIDSGIAGEQGETGGRNEDFVWNLITGDNDPGTGDWYSDGGPHGTHVAGTIAAADNGMGVVGMAPGVPLHIIKVFNAAGWGYSSDLAYAAQKCTAAGANIISMSLGGGGSNNAERNAFDNFAADGGLVLAAAGNDGNSVVSYPAGYESVMMVGANDADNNIASFSQYPTCTQTTGRGRKRTEVVKEGICVEVSAGGVNTLSTYPAGGASIALASVDGSSLAVSAMENQGAAEAAVYGFGIGDSQDPGAEGKICAIDRGSISFYDKVKNCQVAGGVGAIIVNNEPGPLSATLGASNDTTIPAVGAALEDRTAVFYAANASINIGASDYGFMSGTSMATPAVAGVAALVWSQHVSCSGEEIRNALKQTAQDAGAPGKDVYHGYGIVRAEDASNWLAANGSCGDGGGGGGGGGGGSDYTVATYNAGKNWYAVVSSPDGVIGSFNNGAECTGEQACESNRQRKKDGTMVFIPDVGDPITIVW
ncbi:MAG: S8 family serine peptidase [Halioglobus sp.]